jgi:hypothetical protein
MLTLYLIWDYHLHVNTISKTFDWSLKELFDVGHQMTSDYRKEKNCQLFTTNSSWSSHIVVTEYIRKN